MTDNELIDELERRIQEICRSAGARYYLDTRKTDLGGEVKLVYSSPDIDIKGDSEVKYESIRLKILKDIEESLTEDREKPKGISFKLTPTLRQAFDVVAQEEDLNFSEFLRRAAFAARLDPSILHRPEVEAAESAYKASIGPSRSTWKHER